MHSMYDSPSMITKAQRQETITRLVGRGRAGTQGELIKGLRSKGVRVDQSTLSRDLAELGIRKSDGRYVIAQMEQPHPDQPDYSAAVRWYTSCGPHTIVIRTNTGQAQPIAFTIDEAGDPSILATVAGDDTIFVATKTRRAQAVALRRLKTWFGDKYER